MNKHECKQLKNIEDLDEFADCLLSWNATWKLKNDVQVNRQIIYQLANVYEWITEGIFEAPRIHPSCASFIQIPWL